MEEFYQFVRLYLTPVALIGLAAAILLLFLRRKKNGVRPPCERVFLFTAIALILFAIVTLIVIPLIHLAIMFAEFGTVLFYASLK